MSQQSALTFKGAKIRRALTAQLRNSGEDTSNKTLIIFMLRALSRLPVSQCFVASIMAVRIHQRSV